MSKIMIKSSLKDEEGNVVFEYNGLGIKGENTVFYNEEEVKAKFIFLDGDVCMLRKNSQYLIEFVFTENEIGHGAYTLTGYNSMLPFDIKTTKLINEEDKLEIDYTVDFYGEITSFKFRQYYEVIE